MSDRESRLKDELKIKSNDVEMLRRQKAQLHSEIRELNSLSEVVLKVIRLTKNIHKSSTWKIGRFGVNLISRLTLRKPKADFMVEIGQIETELLDFAKLGHVEDDQELKHREGESNIASASVKRRYRKFDTKLESKIKLGLNDYVSSNPDIRSVTVSIVMPTHNRAHTLARAIDSVVAQEHKSWELIVVDDGSTDNTDEVLEIYSNERRIKFHKIRKSGVGSARNVALENATGDIISFLDSDNEWYPDYLTLTVASLKKNDACIAYSGLELTTGEEIVGYRGDKFDYAACLVGNYVDLNCFSHRREVFSANRFDIGLKRYNDWDYILHVTKGQHVSYIPFVGVKYFINASEDQISLKEPFVYRKLVSAIHSSRSELDTEARPSVMQVLEDLSLSFGFRVATKDSLSPSYDFRAAQGLRQALERRGHSVHIYYSEERVLENQHDIVLSIRGSDYHPPIKGMLNVVWSIGDPASTGLDELDEFDMIFVASRSFQKMLQLDLGRSVYYLPNATDRSQFFYSCSSEPGIASEFVYIGDAGDEESQSVKHAQYAQLPLSVYGNGWVDIIPAESHKGSWLRQEDERPLYANSLGVLLEQSKEHNDYGYVDGMVFDGLASGASVLTEFSYELDSLLSNTVAMYSDSATFTQAVEMSRSIASNPEVQTEISSLMLNVHSYDNRARTFSESINSFIANRPIDQQCNQQLSVFSQAVNSMLSGKESLAERLFNKRDKVTIGFFPQVTKSAKWSSSAYIRIVQPLTSPEVSENVSILSFNSLDDFYLADADGIDFVIISRTAIGSMEAATLLVQTLSSKMIPFVVDVDDGFHLMTESHPEFDKYRVRIEVLLFLFEHAQEIWCATPALQTSLLQSQFQQVELFENTLDPRLWQTTYLEPKFSDSNSPLQILYMGSRTHHSDLEFAIQILDRLAADFPGKFELTVIGVSPELPKRAWLRVKTPLATETEYPKFSRWMRGLSDQFDLGIAPLVESEFNNLKSDLKVLEYVALGMQVLTSATKGYAGSELVRFISSDQEQWYQELSACVQAKSELRLDKSQVDSNRLKLWSTRCSTGVGQRMERRIFELIRHRQNSTDS